ncbi:unnamed protein product, partial [Choristocarpus tenellus]
MSALDPFEDLLSSHSVFISPLGGNSAHDDVLDASGYDHLDQQSVDRYTGHEDDGDYAGEGNQPHNGIGGREWEGQVVDKQFGIFEEGEYDHVEFDGNGRERLDGSRGGDPPQYLGQRGYDSEAIAGRDWRGGEARVANPSWVDDGAVEGVSNGIDQGGGSDERSFGALPVSSELEDQPVRGNTGKNLSLDELIEQGERQMKEAQAKILSVKLSPGGERPTPSVPQSSQTPRSAAKSQRPRSEPTKQNLAERVITGGVVDSGGGLHFSASSWKGKGGDHGGDADSVNNVSFATTCSGGAELNHLSMGIPPAAGGGVSGLAEEQAEALAVREFHELEQHVLREEQERANLREERLEVEGGQEGGIGEGQEGSEEWIEGGKVGDEGGVKSDRFFRSVMWEDGLGFDGAEHNGYLAWQADANRGNGPGAGRYKSFVESGLQENHEGIEGRYTGNKLSNRTGAGDGSGESAEAGSRVGTKADAERSAGGGARSASVLV